MAKEFKEYEKKYAYLKGTIPRSFVQTLTNITEWKYKDFFVHPSQQEARWAVYEAPGWQGWQQFRVCLKGWRTKEKLAFLEDRWEKFRTDEDTALERIRINNYIGALKRGGQLDDQFRIQK